jgi:hypothetical protein
MGMESRIAGRRRRWSIQVMGAAVAVLLSSSSPARAGGADADELIRQGLELRRKADDVAALQKFEEAYRLAPTARALAQMGIAEQALGRWAAAHDHLTEALQSKDDRWIEGHRAALGSALDAVDDHVGQITILGGSEGAEVRLDGVLKGKLPLSKPIVVSAGTVTIQLSAPGFEPVQRTTVVRPHARVRESFEGLTRSADSTAPPPVAVGGADAPPPAPAPASPAPRTDAAPPSDTATALVATPADQGTKVADEPHTAHARLKWVAWGAGAAALGVGIFGLVRQNGAGSDFDDGGCRVDASGRVVVVSGGTRTVSDCTTLKSRVDSGFTLEVIGFASAAALAGAGLVLWLTEPSPSQASREAFACAPSFAGGAGAGLSCGLRF